MPGDSKPVSLIEDTSVLPEDLPQYIADFKILMQKHNIRCIFHAHIGSGEIHLRPILNLKLKNDRIKFRNIAKDMAALVKRHKGSLSGEHGDGRLRGEFIEDMIGANNYELLRRIKNTWDPNNIFNPNKIINTPQMNTNLRYDENQETRKIKTYFNFSKDQGIIRATERCNGSGDCRNTKLTGRTMCPSYQASLNEKNTTRARANILREFLSYSEKDNPFDHKEIYEVLDLCLSCKACKSECPSNVDMAKLKAEFLQHYYEANGASLRSRSIAKLPEINKWASKTTNIYNFLNKNNLSSSIIKATLGFAQQRELPLLSEINLEQWCSENLNNLNNNLLSPIGELYLFIDEFTNYNESEIGITCIKLLNQLGYVINTIKHEASGRTYLSKGFVKEAKEIAIKNIDIFKDLISKRTPLVGIESSAILTFRDEYLDLCLASQTTDAQNLAKNCFTIEEFIWREIKTNNIKQESFTEEKKEIKFHAHCYQKALSDTNKTKDILSFPINYIAEEIHSGCCGMAGSFGYEKEHYKLSVDIANMILIPAVNNMNKSTLLAAAGTSCRHQIKDLSNKKAKHPLDILFEALK